MLALSLVLKCDFGNNEFNNVMRIFMPTCRFLFISTIYHQRLN